jgi:hypothetical protein
VSVVDTPANEVDFIVAKRKLEADAMASENTDQSTQTADVAKVAVDVAAAENAAVDAAMAKVTTIVDGIAKAAGVTAPAPAPAEPEATDADDEGDDATEDVLKAADAAAKTAFKAQLEKQGLKGKALDKAMDKRFPVKKSVDADAPPAAPAPTVDDMVSATLDTIQKAKGMTPARIKKLNEAIEVLTKLQMEVIGTGGNPKSHVPQVSQHPNPNTTAAALTGPGNVDVSKLLEAQAELTAAVAKRDAKLTAALEDVTKRLDGIEGARPAPKAGDGDDTDSTVTKNGGVSWGSVL